MIRRGGKQLADLVDGAHRAAARSADEIPPLLFGTPERHGEKITRLADILKAKAAQRPWRFGVYGPRGRPPSSEEFFLALRFYLPMINDPDHAQKISVVKPLAARLMLLFDWGCKKIGDSSKNY